MKVYCPTCGNMFDVRESLQGEHVPCAACSAPVAVPIVLQPVGAGSGGAAGGLDGAVRARALALWRRGPLWRWGLAAAGAGVLLVAVCALWPHTGGKKGERRAAPSPAIRTAPQRPDRGKPTQQQRQPSPAGERRQPGRQMPKQPERREVSPAPVSADVSSARWLGDNDAPVRLFPSVAFRDGFEDGFEKNWEVRTRFPNGPHGQILITEDGARSGRHAIVTQQASGEHVIGLERNFEAPCQGEFSVWLCFAPQPNEGLAGRRSGALPHTCFRVEGDNKMTYMIMECLDTSGADKAVKYESRAIGAKGDVARGGDGEYRADRQWHRLRIRVGPEGAEGWVDGQPLKTKYPALTACSRVRFEIGWSSGGGVAWDDFEYAPLQKGLRARGRR